MVVSGLEPNLFYNSPMESCVVIIRMNKPQGRKNKVLFINDVKEVTRERAFSFLSYKDLECLAAAYFTPEKHEDIAKNKAKQPSLFDVIENIEESTAKINQNNRTISENAGIINELKNNLIQNDSSFIPLYSSLPASIYEAVLPVILQRLEAAMSSDELAKLLDVNKTQLNVWLKKAVDENKIIKLSKPVRYQKRMKV